LRICVLYSEDTEADDAFPTDPRRWLDGHDTEAYLIRKATAVRQVRDLVVHGRFDVFLNLCDGAWDEARAGVEVVRTLERLGAAFTGANSAFFDPSREAMKLAAHAHGIGTPNFLFATEPAAAAVAAARLRFPMIVKHPHGYASIGMTREARVETPDQLRAQVTRAIDQFGGALIEEFIAGREFTVLVAEDPDDERRPVAYTPAEIRFPPGESFKHYDLKWFDYAQMAGAPVEDPALAERLKAMSVGLFVALSGVGYGRCDIRMDAQGDLYMLEINPNCGIFYPPEDPGSADQILAHEPGGHRAFLGRILAAALRRRQRHARRWTLGFLPGEGYGCYAARPLAAGELVEPGEERPVHLVTRDRVERGFSPERRRRLARDAWPVSDELWAMWSDDPDAWRPFNHSCDPNAWLAGLDLVARRPIAAGEQITLDYATLYGDDMEPFTCRCRAPDCRGVIRGGDHRLPLVEARYGDHVSPYLRSRRRR
jgi:glutathione synthase/RimK-type ligase-like ATP-grasp enzyme